MSSIVRIVLIERRDEGLPAIIWNGQRGREQYLGQNVIDQMGQSKLAMYWAELIDDIWHIGNRFDVDCGPQSTLHQRLVRPHGGTVHSSRLDRTTKRRTDHA